MENDSVAKRNLTTTILSLCKIDWLAEGSINSKVILSFSAIICSVEIVPAVKDCDPCGALL